MAAIQRGPGRPRTQDEIQHGSSAWPRRTETGVTGESKGPWPIWLKSGHKTIANILKQHGIEPAPERRRKTTWKEFLRQHIDMIVAADFFTVELGLRRLDEVPGAVPNRPVDSTSGDRRTGKRANGLWMSQIARNLSDAVEGFLSGNGT